VVNRLGKLRTVTANIQVRVVNAATSAELGDILPHLHSARHINHAKQWSPYATNLGMLDEYRKLRRKKHAGAKLRWCPIAVVRRGG
jgi:hypothetical protein